MAPSCQDASQYLRHVSHYVSLGLAEICLVCKAMRELRALNLERTGVQGALDDLTDFDSLEVTRLASTRLTGSLTPAWRGKLQHLRHLYLAAWASVLGLGGDVGAVMFCIS